MTHHLLTLSDLTRTDLAAIVALARRMKADPRAPKFTQALAGRTLGMLFEKPSTRTRISFEVAMNQLGGSALMIRPGDSQLGRGETIPDTARTLSRFLDGLMIRTFGHHTLAEWATHATIPIINGLTDLAHPCQALADLVTLNERFGDLRGLAVAYVGDGNNVAHSLMVGAARSGMDLRVATPAHYPPDAQVTAMSHRDASASGGTLSVTCDPAEAVRGARAVYTDVWASMGQEDSATQRSTDFAGFQVNEALMAHAATDAIFMHCLPAHRGEEVSAEVMDGPQSVVFDQAENRLHAQKALLSMLLNPS